MFIIPKYNEELFSFIFGFDVFSGASIVFLPIPPIKATPPLGRQVFFMAAAGMSMVFAAVVSFSFRKPYGNYVRPFKEPVYYWFADKLGCKFTIIKSGWPYAVNRWEGKEGGGFFEQGEDAAGYYAQRGAVFVYLCRICPARCFSAAVGFAQGRIASCAKPEPFLRKECFAKSVLCPEKSG